MRIIKHSFSDFYDGVMALGHDEDRARVYLRACQVVRSPLVELPSVLRSLFETERLSRSFDAVIPGVHRIRMFGFHILLAGKTYRAVRIDEQTSRYELHQPMVTRHADYNLREGCSTSTAYFYDAELALAYVASRVSEGKLQEKSRGKRTPEESVRAFLANQGSGELEEYSAANKRMIACFERYDRQVLETINPQLASIDFFKQMAPWSVYQELDMYLGGVIAVSERQPEPLDDKYRIAAHGFDKGSFRKAPENRGNRR